MAAGLRADRERLAALITSEMGKPVTEARAEIDKCAVACDFYGRHAEAMLEPTRITATDLDALVAYRPLGVVLAIMPWNFPFWQVFRFLAPAIMAGNVGVLKHAPNTTGCALAIADLAIQAGLPEGGFTALLIEESQVEALIADSRIAAVTLTGSERAGAAVGAIAGKHLKKTVFELGGSDAFIVCRDADLKIAVPMAVRARFQNAGQSCIAAKRFLVDARVYEAFVERFTAAVRELIVGDPREDATQIGPLARRDLRDAVHRQVEQSIRLGASAACGGTPMNGAGFYYEPTVLTQVTPTMPVMHEEVFGPVAPVMQVRDVEEAIDIANASPYGLGASIWTRDVERGKRLASRFACGTVVVNGMVRSDPRLPFGGVKHSGHGRELGAFGMLEFMNIQSIIAQ